METIDFPIHIPTALGVAVVFLALWSLSFALRRQRTSQTTTTLPETKRKRSYTKKPPVPPGPVPQ